MPTPFHSLLTTVRKYVPRMRDTRKRSETLTLYGNNQNNLQTHVSGESPYPHITVCELLNDVITLTDISKNSTYNCV